jgi:DNA-binding response OmpR family regulator
MADQGARRAVLIVESDSATSDLYVRELSRYFEVLACGDTTEALLVLERQPLHAVVLEPVGLGAQGWNLLRAARNCPLNCRTPFVVCSTVDDRRTGVDRGATVYLVKPVLPATLISVLQHLERVRR